YDSAPTAIYTLSLHDALPIFDLDFDQSARCRIAAHHRVPRRGPGEDEPRVVGFATHGVMAGAEAAPANHRNLWHHAVGYGVHHRSEEHTSELQSRGHLVCRLL